MLVNGLLTNSEIWYGLSESEVNKLEEVDRLLLRQIFQVASTCPTEALYLELGCIPLGCVIKGRRIKYLHHLIAVDENELLSKYFYTQWKYPGAKNEWTEQVKRDLDEFGLSSNLAWIKSKSKSSFRAIVKKKTREFASITLTKKREKHSKMDNLTYGDLEMQGYLKNEKIRVNQARSIFRFRTRMARFWENFKGDPLNLAQFSKKVRVWTPNPIVFSVECSMKI